jgi:hypothetical protein
MLESKDQILGELSANLTLGLLLACPLHGQVKQTGRASRLQARLFSGFRAGVSVTLPRHVGNGPGDRGSNRALPHPAEARLPGHV